MKPSLRVIKATLLGFCVLMMNLSSPPVEAKIRNWGIFFFSVPLVSLTFGVLGAAAFVEPTKQTGSQSSNKSQTDYNQLVLNQILKNEILERPASKQEGSASMHHPEISDQVLVGIDDNKMN